MESYIAQEVPLLNAAQVLQKYSHDIGLEIAPRAITHLKSDKVRRVYRAGVNVSHIKSPVRQIFLHMDIDLSKLPDVNPLIEESVTLAMFLRMTDKDTAENGEKVDSALRNLPENMFRLAQTEAARLIGRSLNRLNERIDSARRGAKWSEDDESALLAAIGLAGRLPQAWQALATRLRDNRFHIEDCLELWLRLAFATFFLLKELNVNDLNEDLIDAWDHELVSRFPELLHDIEPLPGWPWT